MGSSAICGERKQTRRIHESFYRRGCQEKHFAAELEAGGKLPRGIQPPSRGLLQQVAGWVLSRYPLPSDSPFVNQFFNLLFGARQEPGPLFEFVTRQD